MSSSPLLSAPVADYDDSFRSVYRAYKKARAEHRKYDAWQLRQQLKRGRNAPCLDYSSKSQTRVPHSVYNRVRVYRSGEIESRVVMRNAQSKPPTPNYGKRFTRGVSKRGARLIRRSVSALVKQQTCQVALYTLTSQQAISDDDFKQAVSRFLAWGRKYCSDYFEHYVIVYELQKRGVLHAHMILFKRVPKGLWRRMRDLWADKYGMGAGSFDCKPIRRASRAAAYISKLADYVSKGVGGKSATSEEKPVRDVFSGNSYQISDALRYFAAPVAEYHLAWGSPVALRFGVTLRGGVMFHETSQDALTWLRDALDST